MTQQQLPLDLRETRAARLERIALLLNGPTSGKVQRADVYFTEKAHRDATAKAEADAGPAQPPPSLPGPSGHFRAGQSPAIER